MLTSTYIHMPRIGATVEKRIWSNGIRTWDEFMDRRDEILISPSKKDMLMTGIRESIERLESHDFEFFAKSLPKAEHWRAFNEFSGKVAYVDIETTGLSPGSSYITVVGIYDGNNARTFVKGIDLDDIVDVFPKYDFLVSFNGARFDLPFIKREFPQIEFNQLHADLMYPLRRISLSGGLKKIECELGISRAEETVGISGFDAVRLWHQYERGDDDALDLLLKYNREDIVNLKTIIDMTLPRFIENKFSECI
ncbi:ribonuclease H-like domain-containing protein [Methanolobus sp.]|jgi:uncharacterized protein YprB with RNaseH-like and TPR domain|uniref:ribonuclease H-like domain-containing protein n=1 Tax=Methanolobus sp. TaxID=1874737 RepID=UPI0025DBD5B0|nr:ribonuclease H-like domain-containing protein [Methanolobus sp.]